MKTVQYFNKENVLKSIKFSLEEILDFVENFRLLYIDLNSKNEKTF